MTYCRTFSSFDFANSCRNLKPTVSICRQVFCRGVSRKKNKSNAVDMYCRYFFKTEAFISLYKLFSNVRRTPSTTYRHCRQSHTSNNARLICFYCNIPTSCLWNIFDIFNKKYISRLVTIVITFLISTSPTHTLSTLLSRTDYTLTRGIG